MIIDLLDDDFLVNGGDDDERSWKGHAKVMKGGERR
jgi:hypothetical protein